MFVAAALILLGAAINQQIWLGLFGVFFVVYGVIVLRRDGQP